MGKFKVGDRVRVQGFARDEKGTVTHVDHKGTPWYVKDGGTKSRPPSGRDSIKKDES